MKIHSVALTVQHLQAAAAFYCDVLGLPVSHSTNSASIQIGASRLELSEAQPYAGAHHLAFNIHPEQFELARAWLAERVQLLDHEGSTVIEGIPGWNSRSLHFTGPEGIILEYIARDAYAALPVPAPTSAGAPRPLSLGEAGLGVADVATAMQHLSAAGLAPDFKASPAFAPLGDEDGMLIVVPQARHWFPENLHPAATGCISIRFEHEGMVHEAQLAGGQLELQPAAPAMIPLQQAHLRIARPVKDMDAAVEFWTAGLGATLLGRQREDEGTLQELAFIGWPGGSYHLELVQDSGIMPSPTEEDMLVLYLEADAGPELIQRIEAAGGQRAVARNPYWNRNGTVLRDPDGYWLVLASRGWSNNEPGMKNGRGAYSVQRICAPPVGSKPARSGLRLGSRRAGCGCNRSSGC